MSKDLSNDLYNRIVQKLIKEWGYKESSISFNFLDNDDIAIFYEDKPHLEENLFAIVNTDLSNSLYNNIKVNKKISFGNQNSFKFISNQSKYKHCRYIVMINQERDLIWERVEDDNFIPSIFPIAYNRFLARSIDELIRNYDYDLLIEKSFIKRQPGLFLGMFFIKCVDEHEKMALHLTPYEYKDILTNNQKAKCLDRIYSLINSVLERYEFMNRNYGYDLNNHDNLTTIIRTITMLQNYRVSDLIRNFTGISFKHNDESIVNTISELIPKILNPQKTDKIIDPNLYDISYLLKLADFLGKSKNTIVAWNEDISALNFSRFVIEIEIKNFYPKINYGNFVFENKGINEFEEKISDFTNDFNSYDILITQLTTGHRTTIKNNIEGFDLGYKWVEKNGLYEKTDTLNGQTIDILYLELCIKLLKSKGKMSLILSEGILQKPSLKYVREYILKHCKLIAVVSTPVPSTCLVILEKYDSSESILDYNIFYGNLKSEKNFLEQFKLFEQGKELKKSDDNFIKKYSELENRLDYGYYSKDSVYHLDKNFKPLYGFVEILSKKAFILKDKNSLEIMVKYIELSDVDSRTGQIVSHKEVKIGQIPKRAYFELEEGDIILSTSGHNLGTHEHPIIYVTDEYNKAICSSNFRVLRPRKNLINTFYLLAFLKTKHFSDQILRNLHGSVTPTISDDSLKQILIYYPDKEVQEDIGNRYLKNYMLMLENIRDIQNTLEELNDIIV